MRAIFVALMLLVQSAGVAVADEDSIFEGSMPVHIQRELEIAPDTIVEYTDLMNIGDPDNITTDFETWSNFTNLTGAEGSWVGPSFKENKLAINRSGAVVVSGVIRAPSDAIMSGASEGWMRIPLSVKNDQLNCALNYDDDPFYDPTFVPWLHCSPELDIRMQVYHIGNVNSYNLTADGYPNLCCKWGPDTDPDWSRFELFDSYYNHSINPLAHPTKVWDQVYRSDPHADKCSPWFAGDGAWSPLPITMPRPLGEYYWNLGPEYMTGYDEDGDGADDDIAIQGHCHPPDPYHPAPSYSYKSREAMGADNVPRMGDDIRYDVDNRTYLWWSFPWYPDEYYAYIIETNNSMANTELYWTTSDLNQDGIAQSYIKFEDNMHWNSAGPNSDYPPHFAWHTGGYAREGTTNCLNGVFKELCKDSMVHTNMSLPINLGTSVLFTQGQGYGVRGFNLTSTATVYENNAVSINGKYDYRTPLNGIIFYDELKRPFDKDNDRLTFTMPFSLPDVKDTNTTDYEEKAIVTTCVQGLGDDLQPISEESWTCNQQIAVDHVIISGRESDIDVSTYPIADQNAWGHGLCYNHQAASPSVADCDEYGDYGQWYSDSEAGFEQPTFMPVHGGFMAMCAPNPHCSGDEFLHGATYLKFWMSFESYDPPTIDGGGLIDMSPQCQYSQDNYNFVCNGNGTRIWIHDFAADSMDENSWLTNSMWVFEGGNLSGAHTPHTNSPGFFDHHYFSCVNTLPYNPLSCPGYPSFDLWTEKYKYANGIDMWNNSVHMKNYKWRPFHTTEITEGTLANINPIQVGQIFEYHLTVVFDNVVYTGPEAWEIYANIVEPGIETGDVMLDSFDFTTSAGSMPLQFAGGGLIGQEFKEIYDFVEQTTKQCESLNPGGNGKGGFCEPGMLNWHVRKIIDIPEVSLIQTTMAHLSIMLDFIVNRLEDNLNDFLKLMLFLISFVVFAVGVTIIWHSTRMLTAVIRGEDHVAQELADPNGWGAAGWSKTYKNMDHLKKYGGDRNG
jgi:hypothetical protein